MASLVFKPHRVRVQAPVEDVDAATGEVGVMEHGDASLLIDCKLVPLDTEAAFRALGIEPSRGYSLLCEREDAASSPVNARVIWEEADLTLRVVSPVKENRAFVGLTDHARILLSCEDAT